MDFDDIGIQYYRLLRHYNFALNNSDQISFLDLSHVLRIWSDMKSNIDYLLKNDYPSIRFKNPRKSKKVDKILKGSKYKFLPLASGVNSPGVQIKGIHIIDRALTPDEIKKLSDAGPPELKTTNISFSEWLGSGIYKVPDLENDGKEISISRELLIKRVANLLGASHPKGTDDGLASENRFDKYIADLHNIRLAGQNPATYYQLMEIAKDILNTLKTIFMKPVEKESNMDNSLSYSDQTRFTDTSIVISEITKLLHNSLNNNWLSEGLSKLENGEKSNNIHPFINLAFIAHSQISEFIQQDKFGVTPEIFELTELAFNINALIKHKIPGIQNRLARLTSDDFSLYRPTRYEIQIAGMVLSKGYKLEFIEESIIKKPDILIIDENENVEIECKNKEPSEDQIDYIRSIYNNTQTARKQFSKTFPGIIFIEIDKSHFDEFVIEKKRLETELYRAMRNSTTISAIMLTSKICLEDSIDYIFRHRVMGFANPIARLPCSSSFQNKIICH